MQVALRKYSPYNRLIAEAITFAVVADCLYEDYPLDLLDKMDEIIKEIQKVRINMFLPFEENEDEDVC